MSDRSSNEATARSPGRRRAVSPVVFDERKLKGRASMSPTGYGGGSSTDGEITDSDNDTPLQVQSTIVPVSTSKTSVSNTKRGNSVEPPSPSRSCSESPTSPKSKRRRSRSKSESQDQEDVPEWKRERSFTPEDEMKPRKWQAATSSSSSRNRRSHRERDEERERRERRRREERRHRFNDDRDESSRRMRDYERRDRYSESRRDRDRDYHRRRDDRHRYRRDSRSPADRDKQKSRTHEKENVNIEDQETKQTKPAAVKKDKEATLITRTGGAYIPPARLRMMQQAITDKSSPEYQRMAWEALKKSINGLVNKVNVANIKDIMFELLAENVIRGRGLLCRSIIQAQHASPTFTNVYAAVVSVINSKFPQIGELLMKRLILQFRRGYRRNDKSICLSATHFIAHLVNQQVAHEVLALEVLTLLLERATDDSVEIAVGFLKECGQKLTELSPRGINAIFERMRTILHEKEVALRVQYMIEVMFQVRKDKFKDHESVLDSLVLVEEEDQFTHLISLDEVTNGEDMLNVFKVDPEFQANEEKYKEIKKEILDESGSGSDSSGGDGDSGSESDSSDEEAEAAKQTIIDQTETNLVGLRRTIYLTLQSSLDYEEAAHKLLKLNLKPGQEVELCNMILDCGAQQRTYEKFYGLLAQRFCMINKVYVEKYEEMFMTQYETCHRLDPTKLRNVSKFFGHLLHTDAISWGVLQVIKMNEDDTTSSSRIFVKQLFLELAEYMGLPKLNERLKDETLQGYFEGIMPKDHPKKTRFAINFFTSIGLGGLTDGLREHLKNMPKPTAALNPASSSSSSSSSSGSSTDSSSSSTDSD